MKYPIMKYMIVFYIMGKNYNNNFSKNIIFKYNKISNSYGEGLDFLKCMLCNW